MKRNEWWQGICALADSVEIRPVPREHNFDVLMLDGTVVWRVDWDKVGIDDALILIDVLRTVARERNDLKRERDTLRKQMARISEEADYWRERWYQLHVSLMPERLAMLTLQQGASPNVATCNETEGERNG